MKNKQMSTSKKMITYLAEMESMIDNHEVTKINISKSSVGWHLDHNLKVINNVVKAIQKSDPEAYKSNFSFLGKVFFTLGFFPRGKAKAPKHVKPPGVVVKSDIINQLKIAKTNIKVITSLDKNAYFKHPLFGNINTQRVNRFLELHTNHHLKIMRDILK